MSVGKRIFLKRELPDRKLVEEFKSHSGLQHCRCCWARSCGEPTGSIW